MSNVGLPEIAIVLLIALLVLGPQRFPQAGRSLGRGIREFRAALSEPKHQDEAESTLAEPREGDEAR